MSQLGGHFGLVGEFTVDAFLRATQNFEQHRRVTTLSDIWTGTAKHLCQKAGHLPTFRGLLLRGRGVDFSTMPLPENPSPAMMASSRARASVARAGWRRHQR